jgi:trk system potassium uptake protein TrkA
VATHLLRKGKAEAIELIVQGDKDHSRVSGKSIEEINFPKGAVIGAIVRGDKVFMATRKLVIEEGDHVLLILTDMDKIHKVEELFEALA